MDDRSAKVCFILPNSMADLSVPMNMTNRAVGMIASRGDGNGVTQENLTPLAPWLWMAKGMGEYRTGRYEEAIKWLIRCHDGLMTKAQAEAGVATADLFLAMGNHRMGKAPEAKVVYLAGKDAISKRAKEGVGAGMG